MAKKFWPTTFLRVLKYLSFSTVSMFAVMVSKLLHASIVEKLPNKTIHNSMLTLTRIPTRWKYVESNCPINFPPRENSKPRKVGICSTSTSSSGPFVIFWTEPFRLRPKYDKRPWGRGWLYFSRLDIFHRVEIRLSCSKFPNLR